MLNALIKFSLQNRLFVIAAAALLLVWGSWTVVNLPVDVLPDLNRPRVTVFLEAGGMSPEEIEVQAVLPIETALNGSPGVEVVRSSSSRGIGLVFVEFDWEVDVFRARQLVAEKLTTVPLPAGITPVMGPISSVMGQIMLIGVTSATDSTTGQSLNSASDLRTLADFTIRRRLLAIKGVAQVIPIGGDRLQYQVLVSSAKLKQYNLTLEDLDLALGNTNLNTSGNFFNRYGSEVLISVLGRAKNLEDLQRTVVVNREGSPVLLSQVADVRFGAAIKRGDASVNAQPAVILTVEKQPGANTVALTDDIEKALEELQPTLPEGVQLNAKVFQQKNFIRNALENVEHALRDGFILVVIILFLFLLNFRTTIITLTAIPLSLVITALVFKWFDISINTLTLGGLAIAIGELVDDAIVDVENVFRRLRENREHSTPRPTLQVIFSASSEVRNSIVFATIIVVLVFLPLFQLQGIEGRIFAPLGIAYITSILASLLVSLTVTPALCSYLLASPRLLNGGVADPDPEQESSLSPHPERAGAAMEAESPLVRWLKRQDLKVLNFGLTHPRLVIVSALGLVIGAVFMLTRFGTEFLPPFNEGSFTVNLYAPAGTSLEESNKIGTVAEKLIMRVPDVLYTARRTGRAELDEHVEPVSNSEVEVELREDARPRTEVIADIRKQLSNLAGVAVSIGQPISHRLDHLLSGVRAQVAVKIFGEDLTELRALAGQIQETIATIPGAVDVQVERQVLVPQLTIQLDREALQRYGMQTGEVARDLEVLYGGKVISQILDGQKTFDLLLRAVPGDRENLENIRNTQIHTPEGLLIPLGSVAHIEYEKGINSVSHENSQRRIVVSCNVQGRDLGGTVADIQTALRKKIELPQGYFLQFGGQFEAQKEASRLIGILGIFVLMGIFVVLYAHFRSWRIVAQVMLNIPLALVGSVAAVWITGGTFSVATLVGFITLTGIASRNGIMMISHYLHLMEHEGEQFDQKMIVRGSLERLVPVLMTALVAALALVPLTLDAQAAGKEILYPVATVILGGLLSSTLLDMIVTPTVFWAWGKKAVAEYFVHKQEIADSYTDTTVTGKENQSSF
ncbi:MAG: efflux RND transporter permease subunit [Saprospiraceae bacterium]|nr:efflux RND transporter permease subunit [Saprospiraceae bacterium]